MLNILIKKFSVSFFIVSLFFTPYLLFHFQIVSAAEVNLQVQVIQPSNPQCSNGLDDDGDGKIDYPADPGCSSANDTDETDIAQCSDGIDNDGDGKIDYPADPGCSSSADNNEADEGGGSYIPPTPPTIAVFRGISYPSSTITFLKDSQVVTTSRADGDGKFEITLSGLSAGYHTFGYWAEDLKGRRSPLASFNLEITHGATTIVSGIFVAPTIEIDKKEVKFGEFLNIFGQSPPHSTILIFLNFEKETNKKTMSDERGNWSYQLKTSDFNFGSYTVRVRAVEDRDISNFSNSLLFIISTITKPFPEIVQCQRADLNCDGQVDIVDFSIAAYWWKRPLTIEAQTNVDGRLNNDGKINLVDFSIMAYYWTG